MLRARRICKRCEKIYRPTGKYQKLCEDCQYATKYKGRKLTNERRKI